MYLRVTTILLISIQHLIAAENSTTKQFPALSTPFGNTTTRETETIEAVSNFVTESSLTLPNYLHQLHQKSSNIDQTQQNDFNSMRPSRGKTKFIYENVVQTSGNNEAPRNETATQDQSENYFADQETENLQRQKHELRLATLEKEEFIQSELHNLAKDIAETELNLQAGKTSSNDRPTSSSWRSFFSSIFPQGIMNVFHLSVSTEPKKPEEIPNKIIYPTETNRNKRVLTQVTKLHITPPRPISLPPLPETHLPTVKSVAVSVALEIETPKTEAPEVVKLTTVPVVSGENQTSGGVMTRKDVYDINSAAEGSAVPLEVQVPMESINIFRIHPPNCEDNCDEESEDYEDPLSESGDDNVVAFSQNSPQTIFYPTPRTLPSEGSKVIRNSDVYYSGTPTSEEIIRESTKAFGQKIPFHPAKQLDDFQQEVEKQFDHNEVRIDSEAASRKFLKNFKGKFVKPQQANSGQTSNFKGLNHFELISSTLKPEIIFKSQPSPVKAKSKLHTVIYSAGSTSDSEDTHAQRDSDKSEQITEDKPPDSENLFVPYPEVTPESLVQAFNSITNAVSEAPKSGPITPPWITPNKNSADTKETIPSQTKTNNHLHTTIYSASSPDDKISEHSKNVNEDEDENKIQDKRIDEKPEELYEAYSTNIRPESLLHTYIFSPHDQVLNNNSVSDAEPRSTRQPETDYPPWVTPKPEKYSQSLLKPTQTTYLCNEDQLKNGDCSYSTTSAPESYNHPGDVVEIQKSLEQQVTHIKPYVYYNLPLPLGLPLLSKNPIRVIQSDDSLQSESLHIPESYQQRQQYLQDHQKHLNQQQEYFQQHQIHQYQQNLLQQHQQKQLEQIQKQHELLQQYQQKPKYEQYQQQYQQYQHNPPQEKQQQQKVRYNTVKVEKIVPKPYPVPVKEIVEKIVERPVPVERIVEKPVNVPFPVREVVEKIVDRPYPVEKIIDRPVHIPYPVQVEHFIDRPYAVRVPVAVPVPVPVHQYIDRPYPVEKIIEKPIHVPYPVDKVVEKIVEKHVPIEIEKIVEVEKPVKPKKPAPKKPTPKPQPHPPLSGAIAAIAEAKEVVKKHKGKINLEHLLELVPPPVDDADHHSYKTIPDDVQFILIDDYNGPVPLDNQGYPWNKQEKRAAPKNHNTKRSPEFRRNLRVEYGFRPPLIPSVEIGEKGLL